MSVVLLPPKYDPTTVRAIVVGIPAHNEASRILGSMQSIFDALDHVDASLGVHIRVAADRCDDATEAILDGLAVQRPQLRVVSGTWGSAGGSRHAAIVDGLAAVAPLDEAAAFDGVWVATTDADTVVAQDWFTRQLSYADAGIDAVAGIVELLRDSDHTPTVDRRFADHYRLEHPTTHPHVHGANLGIRATAYLAAGGFPSIPCSEDHALWNELRRQGFACSSPVDVRVRTSARLRSRAQGGFADGLAHLMHVSRSRQLAS